MKKKNVVASELNGDMVRFVAKALSFEKGKKIFHVPGIMVRYMDDLPEEDPGKDRLEFVKVLISRGGLKGTLLLRESTEAYLKEYVSLILGWEDRTFEFVNRLIDADLSLEDSAEAMRGFLYGDAKHEDRVSIIGSILASSLCPHRSLRVRSGGRIIDSLELPDRGW